MSEQMAGGTPRGAAGPAIAACLLATALACIYLVTYWAGLRGGDRAMVRRDDLPAPGAAAPGTAP